VDIFCERVELLEAVLVRGWSAWLEFSQQDIAGIFLASQSCYKKKKIG
jgi:hypothetical protein